MTKVTALERAVIRNIAVVSTVATVSVKEIVNGPEAVKANQVGAVLLNLKRKCLVTQPDSSVVALTQEGLNVHDVEFPVVKSLDELRHASNLELAKERPMTVEELVLTNKLIDVRKASMKLMAGLAALEARLKDEVAV